MRASSLATVLLLGFAFTRPASACCQLGGSACGDPFAIECNNGVVCFVPWRTCPNCTCTTMSTGRTCLPTASEPGTVATLHIDKSVQTPGDLDISWGASCAAPGADYSIHEGALGTWYSHGAVQCTTAGALFWTLTPVGGNRYYLIAPLRSGLTGGLGTNAAGAERPDGDPSCTGDRALAPCP